MRKVCLYPGTFDPITNGHIDIINRARKLFDKVIVAVAHSYEKNPKYDISLRLQMAKASCEAMKDVEVLAFDNLLVDFAKEHNARVIIRGLRAVSDFEYELQIGYANASLWDELETVYLMPRLQNAFISSSVVRSISSFKGNVSHLVPKEALDILRKVECI